MDLKSSVREMTSIFRLNQLRDDDKPDLEVVSQIGSTENYQNTRDIQKAAFDVYRMDLTFISVEQALLYCGDNSRIHQRIILSFALQWMFYSFFVMGLPVIMQEPQFECLHFDYLKNIDLLRPCSRDYVCRLISEERKDEFIVQEDFRTVVSEFQLYCEQQYIAGQIVSIFFIGQSISCIISAIISDRYGRRRIIMGSFIFASIFITLCGLAPNVDVFRIFILLAGMGLGGYETSVLVYVSEISGKRFRNISTNVLLIMWAFAQFGYNSIMHVLNISNWRVMVLFVVGVPMILTMSFSNKYVWESPRFLIAKRRFQEARTLFQAISVFNRRQPFNFQFLDELPIYNQVPSQLKKISLNRSNSIRQSIQKSIGPTTAQIQNKAKSTNLWHIFYYQSLRWSTMRLFVLWFFRYFCYYTIAFSVQSLGGSMKHNFFIFAVIEITAAIVGAPLKLKMERIKLFQFSFIIFFVCSSMLFMIQINLQCLILDILCWQQVVTIILACVINLIEKQIFNQYQKLLKFGITLYVVVLMTYTSQLFPTTIRSLGYGISLTVGQIGSILAPYYLYEMEYSGKFHPLTVISLCGLVGYYLTYYLEETFEQEMPNEIQQRLLQDN